MSCVIFGHNFLWNYQSAIFSVSPLVGLGYLQSNFSHAYLLYIHLFEHNTNIQFTVKASFRDQKREINEKYNDGVEKVSIYIFASGEFFAELK